MLVEPVEVITCLYGMHIQVDPNREALVAIIKEVMGDTYLLAKPVEKLNG